MKQKRYPLILKSCDYNILKNNSMITTCCGSFLRKVQRQGDRVELLLTEFELKELTGFVAGEANHAISKDKEQALNKIYDQLELALYSLNKVK